MSERDSDDPRAGGEPEPCEVPLDDVAVEPEDNDADDCEWHPADETAEAFPVEALATPFARDGLPDHSVDSDHQAAEARAFTIEGLCCIEDARVYVELFHEELLERHWRHWRSPLVQHADDRHRPVDPVTGRAAVVMIPPGTRHALAVEVRWRFDSDGLEHARERFTPEQVALRWGVALIADASNAHWLPVRPVRERCVHYKRQQLPLVDEHWEVKRMCIHPARRSVGGAAMSLQNQNVFGCDFREPYDAPSCAAMNKFDDDKIKNKPHLVRLPLFAAAGDAVRVPEDP